MLDTIMQIKATLDKIKVKGRKDIERMLGCMQALDGIEKALIQNREELRTKKMKEVAANGNQDNV